MKGKGANLARDVYRDLRDRRLLSIAIVLVVAIVAVPFLIKSDAEPIGTSTSVAVAPIEGAGALDAVVVSAPSELRDYRKRLDQFQRQNPFEQQMTIAEGGTLGVNAETGGAESVEVIEGGSTGGTTSETVTEPIETDPVDPVEPVEPVDPDPDGPVEDPGTVLYSTSIDVRVGPAGDTEVAKKVGELEFLPHRSTPVVQHIYAGLDLTSASFVVSPSVVEMEGDGRCAPSPQACQFLLLDVGEEQRFTYEDGVTYRLELLDVNLHEERFEKGLPVADEGAERDGDFSAGLAPSELIGD